VSSELFDEGLQPERTALAWRRTGISMGVGGIAAMKIFPALFGPWAFIPSALAIAIAVAITAAAQIRYRRDHRALTGSQSDRIPLSGGALPAATAVATVAFGILAAVLLIVR
jgi:putative membrane protein